jgi:hypothetical protein
LGQRHRGLSLRMQAVFDHSLIILAAAKSFLWRK